MVFPKQVNSLRKECLFCMWRLYFREAGNILFLFYLKCVIKHNVVLRVMTKTV